jgi:DNA-binding MarR family transcriptional regulator
MKKKRQSTEIDRFEDAWDNFLLAVRQGHTRGQRAPGELTLSQYYLLRPLEQDGSRPLSQLAAADGVTAATATRVIDGLERAGLVQRERSVTDRRAVFVSLTPEGRRRMRRKRARIRRRRQRVYEGLAPHEREQAERLLRHLTELLHDL